MMRKAQEMRPVRLLIYCLLLSSLGAGAACGPVHLHLNFGEKQYLTERGERAAGSVATSQPAESAGEESVADMLRKALER